MTTRNNQPENPPIPWEHAARRAQTSGIEAGVSGGCIAIGNFDGVHRGHQSMLKRLKSLAAVHGTHTVAITFHPHPVAILRPDQAPPLLTSIEDRMALLREFGADHVEVLPVNQQLLNMSAADFFHEFIRDRYKAVGLVEGQNFRFGRDREGDVALLKRLCEQHQIALEVVELLGSDSCSDDSLEISSSRIRNLVTAGNLELAVKLLGHPHRIRGLVTTGAGRGRELGFPTANLTDIEALTPGHGVYAGVTYLNGHRHTVAIHIGPNPTFSENLSKVECHILDYQGDLYGQSLVIELLARIRPLIKFSGRSELMEQIHNDLTACREITSAI